jgi:hypothetical protein
MVEHVFLAMIRLSASVRRVQVDVTVNMPQIVHVHRILASTVVVVIQ